MLFQELAELEVAPSHSIKDRILSISIDIIHLVALVNQKLNDLLLSISTSIVKRRLLEVVFLLRVAALLYQLGEHHNCNVFVLDMDGRK